MKIGHAISNFFSGLWKDDLQPWLKDLLTQVSHDLVSALVPLAHEAIQEVINEVGQLASGATPTQVATQASATLNNLAKKAEAAGLQVAEHDLYTALAGAAATRAVQDASNAGT